MWYSVCLERPSHSQSSTCLFSHNDKLQSIMQICGMLCVRAHVCVRACAPIITDETGVICLKYNNTVQIWYNPAYPSNWPVERQSGLNLPVAVSDLPRSKSSDPREARELDVIESHYRLYSLLHHVFFFSHLAHSCVQTVSGYNRYSLMTP